MQKKKSLSLEEMRKLMEENARSYLKMMEDDLDSTIEVIRRSTPKKKETLSNGSSDTTGTTTTPDEANPHG